MNILHLMSQTHLTGPEVYVADLCQQQMADGNQCLIVSDTLTVKTDIPYIAMSIHNRRFPNRIRNIIKLIKLCKKNKIDIIHAHSRAASWLANIVQHFIPLAYVSTVHGKQSVHRSSQRKNIYGKTIIVVCDYLVEHLQKDLKIMNAKIEVIRNGIQS